jgi:NADH-quinone oxidoreductase subunit N
MTSLIRPELLTLSPEQLTALMPYFYLCGGIVVTMIASMLKGSASKWPVFFLSVATLVLTAVTSFAQFGNPAVSIFNNMMVVDDFSLFFNAFFGVAGALSILGSFRYLDKERLQLPEYYLLAMFAVSGMMMLVCSLDLIVFFIALELMSLPVYVLVGFRRADRRSNEAAMKYFILGSAASAVMLYGTALLYGATQSVNLREILAFVQAGKSAGNAVFMLGLWLMAVGLLFKIATVPFHMWMPDVYEGAPVPVTGFMTTGLKAAAFAAFVRVFISLGYGKGLTENFQTSLQQILWVSAVLTMVIGNIVALAQVNLKRMLAYSSIAHTGYLLVGVLAGPGSDQGYAPIVVYLVGYGLMNLGAFVVLSLLSGRDDEGLNLHDLSGLSKQRPGAAFAMAVFMFSMAGVPPTAGFAAKYLLFYSAVQSGEIWLTVIAVLCSAVSVYYYLRVLVYMYMREPLGSEPRTAGSAWATLAVAVTVIMTLQVGLFPAKVVEVAKRAVTGI